MKKIKCFRCAATGKITYCFPAWQKEKCPDCKGKGFILKKSKKLTEIEYKLQSGKPRREVVHEHR